MTFEVYKLDCERCGRTVEIPAGKPEDQQEISCPQCGAVLTIHWRPQA